MLGANEKEWPFVKEVRRIHHEKKQQGLLKNGAEVDDFMEYDRIAG